MLPREFATVLQCVNAFSRFKVDSSIKGGESEIQALVSQCNLLQTLSKSNVKQVSYSTRKIKLLTFNKPHVAAILNI